MQHLKTTDYGRNIAVKKKVGALRQSGNKGLNRLDVFVLAFGAMIGWGWVVLSGNWIETAGTLGAMLAFFVGGVLVLFVGLVYAELSAAMPTTEGVLRFSKVALGRKAAFICTWAIVLGFLAVIAFEAVALPTVVNYLFPVYAKGYLYTVSGFDIYATWLAVGVGTSLLVAAINYIGVKFAAVLQTILTCIILFIGVLLAGGTTVNGSLANMEPLFAKDGLGGLLAVAVMTPFFYVGFDVIPQAAGEMNISPKKIGRVLVISVVFAVAWYVLIVGCVGATLSHEVMRASELPTADAMRVAFGGHPFAGKLLVIGGISGILTSWNAFYIGASRLLYAMSQEGLLPAWLRKKHKRFDTPVNAILLIAVITSLAPLLGKNMLSWLSNAGSFATVVTYLITSLSFLVLRKKQPEMERPYRIKNWKFVGIVAVLLCIIMLTLYMPGLPSALVWPYEWVILIAWALFGFVLYFVAKHRKC